MKVCLEKRNGVPVGEVRGWGGAPGTGRKGSPFIVLHHWLGAGGIFLSLKSMPPSLYLWDTLSPDS